MNKIMKIITLASAAALLTACSGSGSDPVASSGRITSFGSIVVSDVHYSVSGSATIKIDDSAPVTINSDDQLPTYLAEGMVAEMEARRNDDGVTGTVSDIYVEAELEGELTSKDAGTNTFVMLERTVLVTDDTKIGPAGTGVFGDLTVTTRYEVDGYLQASGAILATRIVEDDNEGMDEFKGIIESVDVGAKTFVITGMSTAISYGSSPVYVGGDESNIVVGQLVEVHTAVGDVSTATRIEFEDAHEVEGMETEMEGLVSKADGCLPPDTGDFMINTTCVSIDGSVIYINGTAADITMNMLVDVDGVFVNGVLVADKIKFQGNRVEAEVTAANVVNDGGTLKLFNSGGGVITVNIVSGVTETDADFGGTTAADIAGNDVEIRGFKVDATSMTATRIEAKSVSEEELRGPVTSVTANASITSNELVILGVTINPAAGVELGIEDTNYCGGDFVPACSAAQVEAFFTNELAANLVVDVDGTFAAGVFTADNIEIQLPDDQ